jgi:hypothetical protein
VIHSKYSTFSKTSWGNYLTSFLILPSDLVLCHWQGYLVPIDLLPDIKASAEDKRKKEETQ